MTKKKLTRGQVIEALETAKMPGFITGLGRDEVPPAISHIYRGEFTDPGDPLCPYGRNRNNRTGYSIFRNNLGRKGICKICLKKVFKELGI